MSPPHYEHPSDFNDTNASFNTGTQMMSQSQPDKAIGLGLLDCQPTPIVTSGSSLRPAFVTDWGYNERAISVSPRLKTEVDDQWVFAGAGGQHLQAPWQTSTTFPTPTDYTSASSLLSPATSRMSHSARTSISSVYASHSLTTCESFDPMLASQTHIAPHLAWSAPGGEDVIAYPGMHDLSMLAASPATSAPDDLSTVFFPMPSSTAGLVPSTLTLATDQMCMESNAGSRYSTEDLEDETVMLVDMPVKKANRKLTTKANAKCSCEHCGMLFQRSHNLKMHMKTHDRQRKKEHKCPYAGCDKEFDRKADYVRHEDAVHLKRKKFRCQRCDARFPRKDTLQRHKADGCPNRHNLPHKIETEIKPPPPPRAQRRRPRVHIPSTAGPQFPAVEPSMSPLFQGAF